MHERHRPTVFQDAEGRPDGSAEEGWEAQTVSGARAQSSLAIKGEKQCLLPSLDDLWW